MKYSRAILAAVALAATVMPWAASADGGERITSFAVTSDLSSANVLNVDEAIRYDFGSNVRHGIYRDIPTAYKDDQGREFRVKVAVGSVTMDGAPIEARLSNSDSMIRDTIGDPNRTITGAHTYLIHYSLSPLVLPGDTADLLHLNITGNGWTVPIDNVTAAINLNGIVPVVAPVCYTGGLGSTSSNCTISVVNNVVRIAASGLVAGDGVTVAAQLPKGSYASYLTPYVPPAPKPVDFALPVLAALIALSVLLRYAGQGLGAMSRKRGQTVIAQYEAPDGLRPAEIGLMIDDRADMIEITATLIDLAVRGHLKIEQTQTKSLFKKADYSFTQLQAADPLAPYESALLTALFAGSNPVKLSGVNRTGMAAAVESIKSTLGDSMKAKGYYAVSPSSWTRTIPSILTVFMIGLMVVAFVMALNVRPGIAALAAIGSMIISGLFHWYLSRPRGRTAQGDEEQAKVAGFKLYLNVAEKDRLNFSDAPAKTPELFNKLLPYAIALGVEKAWAKQFEGMDMAGSTNWYVGNPGFGAYALASSLGSDLAPNLASNFAPVSSSSSGSSFSGGGFGGGGGGSW